MTNSQMKSIGKAEAGLLHRAIDAALKTVAESYGLQYIRTKTLTFEADGTSFRVPVEGRVKTLAENGLTNPAVANSTTALTLRREGLEINALAWFNGSKYRIIGYNSRSPKNRIELTNVATGSPARCSIGMAKAGCSAYRIKFPQRVNEG